MSDPHPQPRGILWFPIVALMIAFGGAVFFFTKDSPVWSGDWIAGTNAERSPRRYVVSYAAGVFSPTNLRVGRLDTVEFRNQTSRTLKLGFVGLEEQEAPAGSSIVMTFVAEGQVSYYNTDKKSEQGTIIVR